MESQTKKLKSVNELKKVYWQKMKNRTSAKPSPLPYKPRWLNCLYAFACGYFWLPCILCGKNHGGHEWYGTTMNSNGTGHGICPECSLKNYNETGDWDCGAKYIG